MPDCIFALEIHDQDRIRLLDTNTEQLGLPPGVESGAGEVLFEVEQVPLLDGMYAVSLGIHDTNGVEFDHRDQLKRVAIESHGRLSGRVAFPVRVSRRSAAGDAAVQVASCTAHRGAATWRPAVLFMTFASGRRRSRNGSSPLGSPQMSSTCARPMAGSSTAGLPPGSRRSPSIASPRKRRLSRQGGRAWKRARPHVAPVVGSRRIDRSSPRRLAPLQPAAIF